MTPPARPGLVDPQELPLGDPPRIEYVEGTEMVLPSGRRVPLDTSHWTADLSGFTRFARVGDGWLIGHFALGPYGSGQQRGPYSRLYDMNGRVAARWVALGEVGGESWNRRFAWAGDAYVPRAVVVTREGHVTRVLGGVVGSEGSELLIRRPRRDDFVRVRPGQERVPVPTTRDPDVKEVALTGTAKAGLVPATFELRPGARPPDVRPGERTGRYVDGLYDLRTRLPALYSRWRLESVSADGRHAFAWRPVRRSGRVEPLLVSTRTGEAISFGVFRTSTEGQVFWEDAGHALLSIAGDARSSSSWVLRLGIDGSVERVAGPTTDRLILPTRG